LFLLKGVLLGTMSRLRRENKKCIIGGKLKISGVGESVGVSKVGESLGVSKVRESLVVLIIMVYT